MSNYTSPLLVSTVSTQRSGTKFLAGCFAAGTQIRPFGEIFYPSSNYLASFATFVAREGFSTLANRSSATVLDEFFSAFGVDGIQFDLMFNQLEAACIAWNDFGLDFAYEYLKSRGAVVISLERSIAKTFTSQKFVELGGIPHYFSENATRGSVCESSSLDTMEFTKYFHCIMQQRSRLLNNMKNYEFFYRLDYETLRNLKDVPPDLKLLIETAASIRGMHIDREYISIHTPTFFRTPVDYEAIFPNYADIIELEERLNPLSCRP